MRTVDRDRETQVAPARPDAPTPTVETEEKTDLEVRRLNVNSVRPIGKPCEATSSE